MTTDKLLDGWKRWITLQISKTPNSTLAGLAVQLRDSAELKTYPGIYISEGGVDQVEAGGVMDTNVWEVEIVTELITTPGEDGEEATSKPAHDLLRNALGPILNNCQAQPWMDGQIGIVCFQIMKSSPVTDEQENYRVTTWRNEATACED